MQNVAYKCSPLAVSAPEGHLDRVLVARPLVEGLAGLERGAVQVQADGALGVADVLHAMQADGVYADTSQTHVGEESQQQQQQHTRSHTLLSYHLCRRPCFPAGSSATSGPFRREVCCPAT